MKRLPKRRRVVLAPIGVALLFWLSGCVTCEKAQRFEPTAIKNAAIGLNFIEDGKVAFVDQKGNILATKPLKDQIDRKYEEGQDWDIREVKTLTVYHVKGSHEIWIHVDGESICLLFDDNWRYIGPCPH